MLHEPPMGIGEVVRRLTKGETAAPGAEHMAALGGRLQGLLAVFFHLPLLLLETEQRHADRDHATNLGRRLMGDFDRFRRPHVDAQHVELTLDSRRLQGVHGALRILFQGQAPSRASENP